MPREHLVTNKLMFIPMFVQFIHDLKEVMVFLHY